MRKFSKPGVLIIILSAIPSCVQAQRMVGGTPHFAGNRSGYARTSFFPFGFSDLFYGNDPFAAGYPVASQPSVIILQAPSAAAAVASPAMPNQPLMIELRGDRYVQVSGGEMPDARASTRENIEPVPAALRRQESRSAQESAAVPAKKSAPAVLVFRDGHREAVSNYTIADGVLYTSGEPYAGGSWSRRIQLSSLDLAETFKLNEAADVKFQLPTAPNEVIVRP